MRTGAADQLVPGKIVRAAPSVDLIVRERLSRRLDATPRVTLMLAMPGYGKSVAAAHWTETLPTPVAWLSLDLLDGDARSFWSHLLLSLAAALPELDDEPQMLLNERGVGDPLFLAALVTRIQDLGRQVVVVLDGLDDRVEHSVLEGLAFLVERADTLRVVVTTRAAPALPLARWHARGWLDEVRQDELCLTDEEAASVGARLADADPEAAIALNRRVGGWPIAFHMALVAGAGVDVSLPALEALTDDSARDLAGSLVAEVLESMSAGEQDTVLALSIFESFDPDICAEIIGSGAAEALRGLLRRGVFLTIVDPAVGRMQFHALFRELLEAELAWRDPARRIELHRRAAMLWRARGDLLSAYHHLERDRRARHRQRAPARPGAGDGRPRRSRLPAPDGPARARSAGRDLAAVGARPRRGRDVRPGHDRGAAVGGPGSAAARRADDLG